MSENSENNNKGRDISKELEEALKRAEENLKGWQRAVADFENYKRRDQEYHSELIAFGQEQVITKFLSILEDLERLLTHSPQDSSGLADWKKGLEGVYKSLHDNLHDLGVERIKTVGESFDPDCHEAIEKIAGEQDNVIAEEIASGYKFCGKLLKPARVKVFKKMIN